MRWIKPIAGATVFLSLAEGPPRQGSAGVRCLDGSVVVISLQRGECGIVMDVVPNADGLVFEEVVL